MLLHLHLRDLYRIHRIRLSAIKNILFQLPENISTTQRGIILVGSGRLSYHARPPSMWTDRRLRKHYLSATTVADGNKRWLFLKILPNTFCSFNIFLYGREGGRRHNRCATGFLTLLSMFILTEIILIGCICCKRLWWKSEDLLQYWWHIFSPCYKKLFLFKGFASFYSLQAEPCVVIALNCEITVNGWNAYLDNLAYNFFFWKVHLD